MKNMRLLFLLAALALGSHAFAAGDAYTIMKQKARNVANPQPTQPAPARPVTPAVAPAQQPLAVVSNSVPAVPTLTADEETAIKKLVTDLNAIKPGGTPTTAQRAQVQKSLLGITDASAAPPADAVVSLANDLAAAWATQKMTPSEQLRVAHDFHKVLHSPALPAADAQSAVASAQVLLKYGGLERDALQKLVDDLKTIAATAKP
jgi:hypothetical protein